MPNIYVRSTDGSDADNGSTWALAKATLTGAAAIDAAGDTIFLSQSHSETTASTVTLALAGTLASPVKVICGNDAAEPPTAVATTAVVATTGASSLSVNGSGYFYGITFSAGSSTSAANLALQNTDVAGTQVYESCNFTLGNSSTASLFALGYANATRSQAFLFDNCVFTFGRTGTQTINVAGRSTIKGGSVVKTDFSGSIFSIGGGSGEGPGVVTIEGVDFSGLASTVTLLLTPTSVGSSCLITFKNCKLPASWTGTLFSSSTHAQPGIRAEMYNCDSTDSNYRLWVEDYSGSVKSETTIVRSSGASDGTTALSWKMVSFSTAIYPTSILESPEIVVWNETTGSSKTVTVEIVHDSQGAGGSSDFTNDEIWMEVQYLGTSGYPLGSFVSNAKADILATAADHPNSSVTWTTTGLTTPVKQYLQVTFTPQEKGFIHAKVYLAKASKTVYIDPLLTVA